MLSFTYNHLCFLIVKFNDAITLEKMLLKTKLNKTCYQSDSDLAESSTFIFL